MVDRMIGKIYESLHELNLIYIQDLLSGKETT